MQYEVNDLLVDFERYSTDGIQNHLTQYEYILEVIVMQPYYSEIFDLTLLTVCR